ncbi:phage tail tip lysozyme [Butyrivibrio sp. INlla21]|uniref:phage tail tip lysozyme n=1 Tax=Butyrivibrio sp. INlla21 TaxID=1520811 RepID=UPI0008EC14FA|nr:phage tail tip lysozyme [Butyrivibrio sp. INlla21]SFU88682.1 hypothetical protein SAMN02910342_02210 [Butyrivibrio sp. INlla21]
MIHYDFIEHFINELAEKYHIFFLGGTASGKYVTERSAMQMTAVYCCVRISWWNDAESGLRANNLQNSFEKKLGMDDEAYTLAVDMGAYGNFIRDGAGYGLAQWTFWSRKQGIFEFAKSRGKSIGDLQMQLDFLWKELMMSYQAVLTVLQNPSSLSHCPLSIIVGVLL